MNPQDIANLVAQGKVAEAIEQLLPEIEREPRNADLLSLLACCKAAENKHDEALEIVRKAIEIEPENLDVRTHLGLLHAIRNERAEAKAAYESILAINPDHFAALNNLSLLLSDLTDYEGAVRLSDRLIEIAKNDYLLFNRANFLASAKRRDEAIACYLQALEFKDSPATRFNLACLLLSMGRWQEAFPHFDRRYGLHPNVDGVRERLLSMKAEWQGEGGGTILLYEAQGAGDYIYFARLAACVKERGCRVLMECPCDLVPLMETCPGVDDLIEFKCDVAYSYSTQEPVEFDCHFPLMALISVLDVDPNHPSGKCPYLFPQDQRPFFDDYPDVLKIGVCWGGNPQQPNDFRRSCPLHYFKPLSEIPGTKLFSLVKDTRPRYWPSVGQVDLGEGVDFKLVDLSSYLTDFGQTARIISQLDLVVTVDTSVAHVTGAIGQRGFLLLADDSDWRWLKDRSDSPWFPSLTLVRGEKPDDWERVLKSCRSLIDMENNYLRGFNGTASSE